MLSPDFRGSPLRFDPRLLFAIAPRSNRSCRIGQLLIPGHPVCCPDFFDVPEYPPPISIDIQKRIDVEHCEGEFPEGAAFKKLDCRMLLLRRRLPACCQQKGLLHDSLG